MTAPLPLRATLALLLFGAAATVRADPESASTAAPVVRGGRVGWARLSTPDAFWRRHADSDPILSNFIRTQTSLNIDPTWYVARIERLDELCRYPLLFTNSIDKITNPAHLANLAEYLRRGGFLLVDSCINHDVTPDPDAFYAANVAAFKTLFPRCEIRRLPDDHPIYGNFFLMSEHPPHCYQSGVYNPAWAKYGLYAVMVDNTPVALLSLSGLQCGWTFIGSDPRSGNQALRMLTNIYVYAMTR